MLVATPAFAATPTVASHATISTPASVNKGSSMVISGKITYKPKTTWVGVTVRVGLYAAPSKTSTTWKLIATALTNKGNYGVRYTPEASGWYKVLYIGTALTKASSGTSYTKVIVPPVKVAPPTVGDLNAKAKALEYLQYVPGFSRLGLIAQLEYEGYTAEQSIYGTDATHTDWNNQAMLDAQQYLDNVGPFSYSGMVSQLEYDQFTPAQAAYGATAVGL